MASEGTRFTAFYAGSTVCAPSRSVLLTGQHTGHTPIRANGGGMALRPDDVTVAENAPGGVASFANRAWLLTPEGGAFYQAKLSLTPLEEGADRRHRVPVPIDQVEEDVHVAPRAVAPVVRDGAAPGFRFGSTDSWYTSAAF